VGGGGGGGGGGICAGVGQQGVDIPAENGRQISCEFQTPLKISSLNPPALKWAVLSSPLLVPASKWQAVASRELAQLKRVS
jgi:hypothetical protein